MTAIDKNWYQLPENATMALTEDYTEYPELDIERVGNFPQNVEVMVAQRRDENGVMYGGFRLTNGLYVYYEVDFANRERALIPVRSVYAMLGWGFELEDIDWDNVPLDPDPIFDHPIFDLSDEI